MRWRPRALRSKVLFIVLAVLLLPPLGVWLSSLVDDDIGERMQVRVEAVAQQLQGAVESSASLDDAALRQTIERVAADNAVRVRVATADGRVWIDQDFDDLANVGQEVGDLFFGPEGAPRLTDIDAALPPLALRDETLAALESGAASGCSHSPQGKLLVCHAVRRAGANSGRTGFVYVADSSRRAIRSLYDVRFQLVKLTLFLLPLSAVLALLMGWWLVRPVERLRRAVLERARAPAPTAPIAIDRPDEIGDLAHAFNALLGSLAERGRQNEAYLADMAHELKNPIAAIRASAERLADSGAVDAQRAQRLADVILRSCGRLDGVVSELLELGRAEAGLPNEEREPVDLAALVRGVVATRAAGDLGGPTIELTGADQLLQVPGVPRRLEAAVGNLLDNAISFAGDGGHVVVRLERDAAMARVEVADDGPGVEPADLPRVFERFYTTRGERRGTGLGLAMTKAVMEAHGGSVRVRSQTGEGAVFTLDLPFT